MTLQNTIRDLKATLGSLKTHLTNAEKNLSKITKTDLEELDKLIEENKSGPKITARRDNLKLLREARKKETDKYENAKKSLEILLGNTDNKIKSSLDALELAITNDPSSVERRLENILEQINSVYVNSQYILSRYKSGQYTVIQKDLKGNKISQEDYIYKENNKNKIIDKLGENATNISLARNAIDNKSKSSLSSILKSHALGTYKSETAQKNAKREERANAISNFLKQSPIPDTLPVDIAGNMITYSHGSQASIDAGGNPAPLSADIEKFTGLSTSQITKMSAQKLSEHYKPQDTSPIADVKPEAASVVNTSPIADVKPEAASVVNTSPIADVKPEATPSENVPSSGDGGGAKSRRGTTKIGGGGGSKGGGTGSSSPINTAPEINRGKTFSPGEVSDEMLKIIEEAVFNGAARAFSQFSNSPMSGPSEFTDSTIDKIGNTVYEAMKKALDYYSASPAFNVVLTGIEPSVIKLLKDELGGLPGGGGTGDMDKLAEEMRLSRESNEKLAKMSEARRKKAKAEANKKKKESEKEKQRIADPNSPESIAKRKKEADAAEREQKKKAKADPNSPENIAKAAAEEEKRKKKEEDDEKKKLKAERQADPFRNRLQGIYKDSKQEVTFLYDKLNSFFPFFNSAQVEAKKTALNTLKAGYEKFDEVYAKTGSAFKGMMASVNSMFKISPITVIMAGLTTAFIGILSAANRLNTRIKEISAELGTSNMQSYELFKNAMNAQTQYDNMYASLRDVRDVQKGILGDSGILLQTNDKALASVADNAKNIGLSVESAGAFYENLRMKGGSDKEASNLMAASLELADKKGFSPQSIVDDIAQNAEFASKYFSNINKHSKSAHRNLIETNLQVKALGLNFQKAAKMTQHLLSFEQSIVAEVEASVALGRYVNIGKARELLLQDDIAGAMTQMMDTMGGYDEFQNMDFAKRQLMANAIGMEVSELEKSLYLREKIGLKDAESLDAAMRNSDYLDKVAGKDVELNKIETKKVMAAERFNTAIEKVSVAFKSSLLPILEAIIPIVDHMAWAINLVAAGIKTVGGVLSTGINFFSGGKISSKRKSENQASPAEVASGTVMSAGLIFALGKIGKSKFADKIGEKVGKVRGRFDQLSGALGSESNPMYVKVVGGLLGGGGSVASTILDNAGGAAATGTATAGASRFSKVKDFLSRGAGKVKSIASGGLSKAQDLFSRGAGRLKGFSAGAPEKIGKALNSLKNIKPSSIAKIGGVMAVAGAAFDYAQRKKEGQSTKQAATASVGGALGSIAGGAVSGAAMGAFLGPIGAAIGGLIGGTAGYLATTKIIDSHFDKNKSSSFTAQPFMYAGMNGMSGGGGISTSLNKPKAKGTPVETSMVDMTPTTFKTMSSGISGISPNYGTTTMARESVMVNTLSKSVEATALMKSVKEKNIEKEKAHKEMMEQQLKILESIREKINQPAVAFFTDEGRRQVINQSRVRNSH